MEYKLVKKLMEYKNIMLMGSIRYWHEATLQYCFILHVPPLKEKREKVLNQETDENNFNDCAHRYSHVLNVLKPNTSTYIVKA